MPGLSLVTASTISDRKLSEALRDFNSEYGPSAELLYRDDCLAVAFAGPEGYPHLVHEDESLLIAFEGVVYNRTLEANLESLRAIGDSFVRKDSFDSRLRDFVNDSDGDYLCAVYSKREHSLLVFNDRYGRLQSFYCHRANGLFALSLEVKFLLHWLPQIAVDRLGLTKYLMFEYTLGKKTLFQHVQRLPASWAINVSAESTGKVQVSGYPILPVSFDLDGPALTREACLEKLVGLYRQSMGDRYTRCRELGLSCIVDVSGGFDTRTVMAGMEDIGGEAEYYTHDLVSGDESQVAMKLGDLYGQPVNLVSASHEVDFGELEGLVYSTDCMVNGWTAWTSWNDVVEKQRSLTTKVACYMGFGGEFIRHPLAPAWPRDSLVSMLRTNSIKSPLNLQWASYLTGTTAEEFRDQLESYLAGYPEQTKAGRFNRFYSEYYYRLVAAGEDRARRVFWTVQPLWSKDIYEFEMNSLPLHYADYSFYTDFMRMLDAKTLSVGIHGSRIRLESRRSARMHDHLARLRYRLRNLILANRFASGLHFRRKARQKDPRALRLVADQIIQVHNGLEMLGREIRKPAIRMFIERGYDIKNYYRVLSVLMYFRQLEERFKGKISH